MSHDIHKNMQTLEKSTKDQNIVHNHVCYYF